MKFHFTSFKCQLMCLACVILSLIVLTYFYNQRKLNGDWISSMSSDQLSSTSRHSFCIPGSLPGSKAELFQLYDGVETFVMFIGYPRSSHSLVGALLDAHPQIIVTHEHHLIQKWDIYGDDAIKNTGMQKYLLFYNLHSQSTWQASFGSRAKEPVFLDDGVYSYNVPGAWQGTFSGKIKVIGDKKGGGTTMEITEKPEKFAILKEINETIGIPLKFLHVIRNPYDVISTWVLRLYNSRLEVNDGKTQVDKPGSLNGFIKSFFELAETNEKIRRLYGDAVLNVLSHEVISKPKETMERICDFLGVSCRKDYLGQAEKILFKKPSVTRHTVVWSDEQKDRVQNEMQKYSFLRSFSFEDDFKSFQ